MSDQLDYEATKAALRAQITAIPATTAGTSTRARTCLGVVSSLVVVACAVVLTMWVTSDPPTASVTMVPSNGHVGSTTSRAAATTGVIPGAPTLLGRTAVIHADGSITGLDAAGNLVTIAAPSAEQTAAVLAIQRTPGTNTAAPVRPVTAAISPARGAATRPTASQSGGSGSGGAPVAPPSNPQPTDPPVNPPPETQPAAPSPPATTQEPAPTQDPTPTRDPSPTADDPAPEDHSGGDSAGGGSGGSDNP